MAAIVQVAANQILTATLAIGGTNSVGATSPMRLRLTTTSPTSTVAGTELTGTGYTTGGTTIAFATASGGSTSGPTGSAITWTNSGGTSLDRDRWAGAVGFGGDACPVVVRDLERAAHRDRRRQHVQREYVRDHDHPVMSFRRSEA